MDQDILQDRARGFLVRTLPIRGTDLWVTQVLKSGRELHHFESPNPEQAEEMHSVMLQQVRDGLLPR